MKLAVFSDVHSNLEALELFLEHSSHLGVEEYACLGDIIGYGPNPNECIATVSSLENIDIVMGNHEWAILNPLEASLTMNPMAHDAIVWTQQQLSEQSRQYISGLDYKIQKGPFTFVHASAFEPDRWEYLLAGNSAGVALCLLHSVSRMTFVGHTHRPMIADSHGESLIPTGRIKDGTTYRYSDSDKILVNPGSIGQPRGEFRKPSYITVDTASNEITWHRLDDYDPKRTVEKILATDLPAECAYYLNR